MMATEEATPPTHPQQQAAAGTPAGVASSARMSLKRARVLFDTGAAPRSGSTCQAAAKRALVPPVDRSLHKAAVARRVRSHYPVVPSDGGGAAGDDEGGGKSKGSASTGLTAQVLAELRQETARRIVRGEAAGTDAGVGGGGGGGGGVAGQIVLHREVDLGIAGAGGGGGAAAAAAGTAAAAGGVLALPGQKVQAVGGAEEGGDASGTVRPGGILVVSRATGFSLLCLLDLQSRDPTVI